MALRHVLIASVSAIALMMAAAHAQAKDPRCPDFAWTEDGENFWSKGPGNVRWEGNNPMGVMRTYTDAHGAQQNQQKYGLTGEGVVNGRRVCDFGVSEPGGKTQVGGIGARLSIVD